MSARILTIEDLDLKGKTVFVRVDINTPVDDSGRLLELSRIEEASVTIRDLKESKVVVASHQGRVGRSDYISMEQHAGVLNKILGGNVKFVEDICGPSARNEISSLKVGEVLLLDNLRFMAEENVEFTPEEASKTVFVQRLYKYFDACVLDAFPTAHRAHPSIIGFSYLLPTCGGRLVVKELKALTRVLQVAKAPYTAVLGGAKVSDRLEAIEALIENRRADKVLLCGLIANVFLRAAGKIDYPLGIKDEDKYIAKAVKLMEKYPGIFELPVDVALDREGERVEVEIDKLEKDPILDIGSKTIDKYSRIIRGSGTVFMSGPAGQFEKVGFNEGTDALLKSMASSLATTIVSGGHLNAALQRLGIKDWIDHVSTAGGALVLYLSGKRLPMIEALERAAQRFGSKE
ncbi:MAG: phosphoglycerate kinase [Nitrososphaerota archaeon]|nr:phosphoglycerate kinase [Nitrososphaerota archaeon]